MACAMMSCGSRNSTPAACVNNAPWYRIELSSSAGIPSSWELDTDSCSTVANGFDRVAMICVEVAMALVARQVDTKAADSQ